MATGHPKTLQHTRRGLRMVGDEPSLFDLSEPIWHPDEKSPKCDICKGQFSFTNRKHHCRRCGDVICSNCSEKQPLSRMGFVDPVLVCTRCVSACKTEDDFFKHYLKILINGAYFLLSDTEQIHKCTLNSDHHKLIITSHESINLSTVMEIKSNNTHSPEGSSKLSSLQLTYQSHGDEYTLVFSPSPSHSRKQSLDWLRGLKKGLVILHGKNRRMGSLSGST